jgi:hypothetical protein
MAYQVQTFKTNQKVSVALNPVDSAGSHVSPDGSVTVVSDTPAACTADYNFSSGAHGVITLTGHGSTGGTANITVSASFSGALLTETIPVHVVTNPAVTFGLVFSPPVSQ